MKLLLTSGGVTNASIREALVDIARSTLVNSVPDRGDEATAFWFMAASPTLWLSGRLLRSAESAGDLDAQRAAGSVLTATGVIGSAAMPRSGFWGVAAVGLSALRRSSRPRQVVPKTHRRRDTGGWRLRLPRTSP